MELWDLYNENREPTGETHIRGPMPENKYHIVIHAWITDGNGKYLISQRAADRSTFPLMWECVGGSVISGETSIEGAVREIKEEVGIDVTEHDGKLVFSKIRKTVNGKRFNDFIDVYLFKYNGDVCLENATTQEVRQVKWMTADEIKVLYDSGKLVNTLSYFFEKITNFKI